MCGLRRENPELELKQDSVFLPVACCCLISEPSEFIRNKAVIK